MKPSFRRYRRRSKPAKAEGSFFKKESQPEHSFFGDASHGAFFQPSATAAQSQSVQRKCDNCEKEDKAQRKEDKKEEDKKLQRATDKKEEDKKLMRAPEKKEEDKKLQRAPEKKEEEDKKIMKAEDKKEEDKKLQRAPEKKEEDDKKLQKKEAGAAPAPASKVSSYIGSLNGKGHTMPPMANQFFSSRIGYDFSNVKLHTDKEAAESAKSVNAKAYTVGNNIVFNEGQYNTQSGEGKKLLAHELAHVVQNNGGDVEQISRMAEQDAMEQIEETATISSGTGSKIENTTHFANCAGVSVQGRTDANYTSSFTSSGTQRPATTCSECSEGDNCITSAGVIVSTFRANPAVTLPAVPGGLSACENQAVTNFINTTLTQHEQQHVAAFNTYNGVVRTRYRYTGCTSGLQAYIQSQHDAIEVPRRAASDALSAALDPFNVPIPCNCPDPAPQSDAG
jgi:hypothetical protein